MKERTKDEEARQGSVLVAVIVLLAIAGFTAGSILKASMTYARHVVAVHCRDNAAFLADAGLEAALVKLNAYSDGNISFVQSRSYFNQTNGFAGVSWGFETRLAVTNGRNVVISVGRYRSAEAEVQAEVNLGSGSRSIHALYAHALFAGNSSGDTGYVLRVGGSGSGADFVNGDTYSGNDIELSGDSDLRLPEAFIRDVDGDFICDASTDTWHSAYATDVYTNPLTQAQFDAYESSMAPYMGKVYNNGRYDRGEAFVDTIGNGVYDEGEPFTDVNGNGIRDAGDEYTDENGNGQWDEGEPFVDYGNGEYDEGEEWTEDCDPSHHNKRKNGRYDPAGGFWRWQKKRSRWIWKTNYRKSGVRYYCDDWPAEEFEDTGDGEYWPGEDYVDQNGVFDEGEAYLDDRNSVYDYGTQASGRIAGMPSPGPGTRAATGGDPAIDPPDLVHMYYGYDGGGLEPVGALERWGHDVAVTASDYAGRIAINDSSRPEHIFLRNPPRSGSSYVWSDGAKIYKRDYDYVYDNDGDRVDDYFLEDPTDSTFNTIPSSSYAIAANDNNRTHTTLINLRPEHNVMLYYVEGNVYIHSPKTYSMRFRYPGTRVTIVARGNITVSDEFYYNADYDPGLQYADMDSTVVHGPQDALCLIALKNPACTNDSGNIYIGDQQFGTGGSIHAMLYAENDFVDNNINSVDQQFISVFGNMTAGNHVSLNRQHGGGYYRTRLDITLDVRIRDGEVIVPGLPHPVGMQRSIQLDTAWQCVPGTWTSWSLLE